MASVRETASEKDPARLLSTEITRLLHTYGSMTVPELCRMLHGAHEGAVRDTLAELLRLGQVKGGHLRKCRITKKREVGFRHVRPRSVANDNPCVKAFGYGPEGTICRTCAHIYTRRWDRSYYKCSFRTDTRSQASDHRVTWDACSKYRKG